MSAVFAGHFSPDLKVLEAPKASPPSDGMITLSPDPPTTLREPAAKRPSSRGPPNDGRCGGEWVVSVLLSEVERALDGNMAFMSIFAHESLSLALKGLKSSILCDSCERGVVMGTGGTAGAAGSAPHAYSALHRVESADFCSFRR